jgi:23S rRNA pseudouridine1911/1915/1917 synthase
MNELEIIFEDNHLLVVNKPPGLATMGAESGPTVHSLACEYIAQKYRKPGKVFLGIVHRLDSMSSGVLVLARTSKAAARLSDQFRKSGEGPRKIYLAVVEGDVVEPRGLWRDWIVKNEAAHRMEAATASTVGAVDAELEYQVIRRMDEEGKGSLIAVRLMTGRKHQIRVQFADRGHAILGDIKYDAARQTFRGIALHAWSLTIHHPTKAEPMTFRTLPKSWGRWIPTAEEISRLERDDAW